ncbi:MAG: hypothetical protein A3H27_06820 [Acidobacteria bacterium RIFCSPLOWO2_02_FULL_59_13]|nr:MAG: hypothetical protein A3H27_06820 [Acidobacteria bacterium RIFCSPLOWO2_02_FULL_59_13]
MRKIYAKAGLVLIVIVFVFTVISFLRENWGADAKPGPVERLLAEWVLSRSHSAGSEARNPFPPTEENLREGRRLYEHQCAFCHGLEGRGQDPNGLQFYPPVPSLVEEAHHLSDGQIHAIISRGIRYTGMPSFAKANSADQIWKTVLWVRRLSRQPGHNPAASDHHSPGENP